MLSQLTIVDNSINAHLIVNHLQLAGIEAVLNNEHSHTSRHDLGTMAGGISVMVRSIDLDKAREELDQFHKNNLVCPNCDSKDVSNKEILASGINKTILKYFAGIPFGNLRFNYLCNNCQEQFYK